MRGDFFNLKWLMKAQLCLCSGHVTSSPLHRRANSPLTHIGIWLTSHLLSVSSSWSLPFQCLVKYQLTNHIKGSAHREAYFPTYCRWYCQDVLWRFWVICHFEYLWLLVLKEPKILINVTLNYDNMVEGMYYLQGKRWKCVKVTLNSRFRQGDIKCGLSFISLKTWARTPVWLRLIY